MNRWIASIALALLLAGCSGSGEEDAENRVGTAGADSATTVAQADAHAMHAMDDTTAPGGAGMAGMDHGAAPAPGSSAASGSAAHPADHGAMGSAMASGGASGMDHSTMGGTSPSTGSAPVAGETMAAMDHSQMGHAAPSSAQPSPVEQDHAAHEATSIQPASGRVTLHSTPSSGAASTVRAPSPGTPAAVVTATAADERLLTLVRELVRDSVVQREIQADSALREAWANPAVRAVILREQ